jgi:CspA family cold shock protein
VDAEMADEDGDSDEATEATPAQVRGAMKGVVKAWKEVRGYGFVTADDGKDFFVHRSALQDGLRLKKGSSVTFDAEGGKASKVQGGVTSVLKVKKPKKTLRPRGFVQAYMEGIEDLGKPMGVTEYPPEAYADYGVDEKPPEDWFQRRKISKKKVNMYFFNMYKKPRDFFPHDIRPGDTLRVYFKDPSKGGERLRWDKVREVFFDGVCLDFKGKYHARNVRLRAMVGKGEDAVGYEMLFPVMSDVVTKIEVLRRGYIGRNKNAYFLRGMIGKKNQIPLDKQRTAVDELYAELREEGREDEIPMPDYPQKEHDRAPYSVWKQDSPFWDESKYNPDEVDQRSEYEKRVIAAWRKKVDPKQKRFR